MIQTKNRGKYRILPGNPEKMGASATKDGYNFAVEVSDGKKAELLLYRKGHQKPFLTVPLPEEERTGVISSCLLYTSIQLECIAEPQGVEQKITHSAVGSEDKHTFVIVFRPVSGF